MILRIVAGAALGGVIGYERDLHRRPVGLRTHFLVAMAAATFMVLSTHFVYFQHYGKDDLIAVDPSRIAASVVSGIGFLAGGAILRTGLTVQGLTTAAGLWLVTAIGMCAGAGMYVESAVVTGLGILALTVLRLLEDKDDNILRRRVSIVLADLSSVALVLDALREMGCVADEVEYDHRLDESKRRIMLTLDVKLATQVGVTKLLEKIEAVAGVKRVRLQQTV